MAQALEAPTKEHYLVDLEKVSRDETPGWVQEIRAQGARLFNETQFPNTRMEAFRQTNVAAVVNTKYQSLTGAADHGVSLEAVRQFFYEPGTWNEVVFIDGYFSESLSNVAGLPEGVYVGSLSSAMFDPQAETIKEHLNRHLGEGNAFVHLNSAFLQDGAYVHVPKNVQVEQPIHLIFVSSAERAAHTACHPRNLIVLDEGAEATVIESYVSLAGDTPYFTNLVGEVALGKNAKLTRYKLVEEGPNSHHLSTTEIHQDRDSRFESFVFSLGGSIVRNELCVDLDGEGAECNLNGLYLNEGDRLLDNSIYITHHQPHCNSRIQYKGVLDGKSHAVFLGKVFVHRDAQKTDSDQLSSNLLLSDTATIDSKPQLEIYADDVKCTHGCTVGPPPEQVIFYFRSRGIDEATARGMLTYGFADEVVADVEVPALRKRLERYVYDLYSPEDAGEYGQ
jgi:Fe-S cluster assembly protein SufD